jgi:hypothetical protein
MNPYDFYSLDDFLEFSPLSPNYANLNTNGDSKLLYMSSAS